MATEFINLLKSFLECRCKIVGIKLTKSGNIIIRINKHDYEACIGSQGYIYGDKAKAVSLDKDIPGTYIITYSADDGSTTKITLFYSTCCFVLNDMAVNNKLVNDYDPTSLRRG